MCARTHLTLVSVGNNLCVRTHFRYRRKGKPVTYLISRTELEELILDEGVVLVDALPRRYYDRMHLPGAINLVEPDVELAASCCRTRTPRSSPTARTPRAATARRSPTGSSASATPTSASTATASRTGSSGQPHRAHRRGLTAPTHTEHLTQGAPK